MPDALIAGGPNGAGKSTVATEYLRTAEHRYLSADRIAAELNPEAPEEAKIQAGKEFFRRLSRTMPEISSSRSLLGNERKKRCWIKPFSTRFKNSSHLPMSIHSENDTELSEETHRELVELKRIGNRAVRRAQEENRRRGIPNVYSIGGHLYYEQPDSTLSLEDPLAEMEEGDESDRTFEA